MNVYSLLYFWTIAIWCICYHIHYVGAKRMFLFLTFVPATTILAIRSPYVGSDTGMYNNLFYQLQGGEISFFSNSSIALPIENSFVIIVHFLAMFTNDSQALIAFYSIITMIIWGWIFYRKTENIYISVLIFIGMFYCENFNGIRQCLAVALIYASFILRFESKSLLSIILLLLSYFIHHSSIIIMPLWFLYPLNRRKISFTLVSVFVLTAMIYFSGDGLLSFFISDKYVAYFYNAYAEPKPLGAGIIKIFAFILVCFIGKNIYQKINVTDFKNKDKQILQFFCMFLIIACCSTILQYRIGIFYRLIYSFSVGLCILIPLYAKYCGFNKYYLYMPTVLFLAFYLLFTLSKNPELNYSVW